MKCINCGSEHIQKNGNCNGIQRYRCMNCDKRFVDGKYEENYLIHFNAKIKKSDRNILTRENYCVPTNKLRKTQTNFIKRIKELFKDENVSFFKCFLTILNDMFLDDEHYTDEWVENHYKNCMKNFDINMKYFESLDVNEFNSVLDLFVRENDFNKTNNLESLEISGIYIMVLDKYKQVYIGFSNNIRKRILNHWSKKKEFDKLIYGEVENSILSIDSFGALDTTRIFYKKTDWFLDMNIAEEKHINDFNNKYLLNRVSGGINMEENDLLRNMRLFTSKKERKFE